MGSVLADFAQNRHVLLAFVSPSGEGVKPVIPVSPIPQNEEEHRTRFQCRSQCVFRIRRAGPRAAAKTA